ncbi:MAG: translesion error-prone DNA polymerase V autoproteolytic subunit [Bacteroidia bacterium]
MTKNHSKTLVFFNATTDTNIELPFISAVKAGFPSPAQDFMEETLDINSLVVKNPVATFYARVQGNSMIHLGIEDGDILVIDKSLEPIDGKIAVCIVDGEFTLKQIKIKDKKVFLMPANPDYPPIEITEEKQFMVWGIVTYIIKKV